ncbi:ATPase family protein [anaerobic digester metagenome]
MDKDTLEMEIKEIAEAHRLIREAVGTYVVGNQEIIDLLMMGVLIGGHILIDGTPGTAKTTISKILARLIGFQFNRVQGVVDVQPADILGVRVYHSESNQFILQNGPIFTNFMLIDEINRLTPKTQSAFIEAMAEHQVTIDGINYPLEDPFFVVATQNSQEFEGTFPLIEAQRDRFTFSVVLRYLDRESEFEILRRDRDGELQWDDFWRKITPVLSIERVHILGRHIGSIIVSDRILTYISDIIIASRKHDDVRLGCSSRGALAFLRGARAAAALDGRTYVIPDDVKRVAAPVMGHRLILERESEFDRASVDRVIAEILESVEVA